MQKFGISDYMPGHWVWTSCPSTHEEVVGSGSYQQFSVPDGYVTWWYCPACQGWHVRHLSSYDNDCNLAKTET